MSFFKNALVWSVRNFLPWATQKTTIAGFATTAGTVTGLVLGSIGWPIAVPMLVGALVGMAIPEGNTAASVQAAVAQGISIAAGKVAPLLLVGLLAIGLSACAAVKTYGVDALEVAAASVSAYAKTKGADKTKMVQLNALLAAAEAANASYHASNRPADQAALNATVSALIAYETSLLATAG